MSAEAKITTDRQVAALRPTASRFAVRIASSRGLWLRVYPSGLKVFELRYVSPGGQHRRLRLGEYPHLDLADASKKAGSLRVQVIDGADPAGDRTASLAEARDGMTLDQVFDAYEAAAKIGLHGGRKQPKKARTLGAERGLYLKHVSPKIGSRKAMELGRSDMREFMTKLASESGLAAPSVARVGEVLSSVFGYLVHTDQREDNPVAGLAHPLSLKGTSRERRFDDAGIKLLWTTLCIHSVDRADDVDDQEDSESRLAPETALALRFALLTMCRPGEAANGRWSEIDRSTRLWEIPGARTKNGLPHVLHLSSTALAVLDEIGRRAISRENDPFLFPSPTNSKKPLAVGQLTKALARLCKRLGVTHGSPHDFRRSGSSTLTGRYGFTRFHVGCVLGHIVKDGASVTAVYDRHDYLPEKRRALDAWGAHVLAVAAGADLSDNVIEFRPGKSA